MAPLLVNWAGTHRWSPSVVHEPIDEASVAALVRGAAGRRVKVVGGAHSWSGIAVCDAVMLDLRRLDAVSEPEPNSLLITVGAGIRLSVLNEQLARRGLALPILGSIAEQSLAGAVSTGTHGSSLVHGNLASAIVGARLVVASGDVLVLGEQDERLPAVRVGLGALGVLTEVTLQCVPAFRLEEEAFGLPWSEAVARVAELAASGEYIKLWWLPHTDQVQVFRCARTQAAGEPSSVRQWIDERLINRRVFRALLWLGARFPSVVPPSNRLVAALYFRPGRRIGRSDRVLTIAMPPVHRETEYAVPLESAGQALADLRVMIEREQMRVNFVVEARFVPADTAWMSPAYGRASCHIGAYMAESPDLARYFAGFEALMRAHGGRAHWGKEFTATPEDILAAYPEAAQFRALAAGMDPAGMFRNAVVDTVLGPPVPAVGEPRTGTGGDVGPPNR